MTARSSAPGTPRGPLHVVHAGSPRDLDRLPRLSGRWAGAGESGLAVHALHPDTDTCRAFHAAHPGLAIDAEVILAGPADGTAVIGITRDAALSSLRELDEETFEELLGHMRDYPSWRAARVVVARREVPVVSIDGWARRKGLARIDLLSVRMPGMVLEVLSGAATLLGDGRAAVVRTGLALRPHHRGEAPHAEVDDVLTSSGYAFVDGRYPRRAVGPVRRDGAGVWGEGPRYTTAGVATYLHGSYLDGTIADLDEVVSAAVVLAQLGFGSTAASVLEAHRAWPRDRTDPWLDTWARPTTRERRLAWLASWLRPLAP